MIKSILEVYEIILVKNHAINGFIIEIEGFLEKNFKNIPDSALVSKLNLKGTKWYPKECKALCNT